VHLPPPPRPLASVRASCRGQRASDRACMRARRCEQRMPRRRLGLTQAASRKVSSGGVRGCRDGRRHCSPAMKAIDSLEVTVNANAYVPLSPLCEGESRCSSTSTSAGHRLASGESLTSYRPCPAAEGVPIAPGCASRPSRTVGALLPSLLRERVVCAPRGRATDGEMTHENQGNPEQRQFDRPRRYGPCNSRSRGQGRQRRRLIGRDAAKAEGLAAALGGGAPAGTFGTVRPATSSSSLCRTPAPCRSSPSAGMRWPARSSSISRTPSPLTPPGLVAPDGTSGAREIARAVPASPRVPKASSSSLLPYNCKEGCTT
jgi:hypothetical protein